MKIIAPPRGTDKWGSGAFEARRKRSDGTISTHNGVDIACFKGSLILSVVKGVCTKIGYPYNPKDFKKGHLRYVEITDRKGLRHRFFYVGPVVKVGTTVEKNSIIGVSQGLIEIYPGITDHIHYEIKRKDGSFVNPKLLCNF